MLEVIETQSWGCHEFKFCPSYPMWSIHEEPQKTNSPCNENIEHTMSELATETEKQEIVESAVAFTIPDLEFALALPKTNLISSPSTHTQCRWFFCSSIWAWRPADWNLSSGPQDFIHHCCFILCEQKWSNHYEEHKKDFLCCVCGCTHVYVCASRNVCCLEETK